MTRRSVDGGTLLRAVEASVAHLERHVDAVDALNVFPVPDGDTGSNMLATMRAAMAEARSVPARERTLDRVASALSGGALMGARGNSGVILSQIVRGMAEAAQGRQRANGVDLAFALRRGSQLAAAAVSQPVEGTILTVIRETAHAAVGEAERGPDVERVLAVAVDAAASCVARTPSLLPVLRDAGVVDSGGQGLYLLLAGCLLALAEDRGSADEPRARPPDPPAGHGEPFRGAVGSGIGPATGLGHGFETELVITSAARTLDIGPIRRDVEAIATSVLVVGDPGLVRVHAHNDRPDLVLGLALGLGSLRDVRVTNLDEQARGARERRLALVAQRARSRRSEPMAGGALVAGAAHVAERPALAVVAVANGLGFAHAFQSVGVGVLVGGGPTSRPSTGEILAAIAETRARAVIVLPNDRDALPAARQAALLSDDVEVVVVPTRNAAEGLAAMLALDLAASAEHNRVRLTAAAGAIRTLQVTDATRDARMGPQAVRRGQTLALGADGGLVRAGDERFPTIVAAVRELGPDAELVTLYVGAATDLAEAEALASSIGGALPGVDVEVIHGGQPHSAYLIAVE